MNTTEAEIPLTSYLRPHYHWVAGLSMSFHPGHTGECAVWHGEIHPFGVGDTFPPAVEGSPS